MYHRASREFCATNHSETSCRAGRRPLIRRLCAQAIISLANTSTLDPTGLSVARSGDPEFRHSLNCLANGSAPYEPYGVRHGGILGRRDSLRFTFRVSLAINRMMNLRYQTMPAGAPCARPTCLGLLSLKPDRPQSPL